MNGSSLCNQPNFASLVFCGLCLMLILRTLQSNSRHLSSLLHSCQVATRGQMMLGKELKLSRLKLVPKHSLLVGRSFLLLLLFFKLSHWKSILVLWTSKLSQPGKSTCCQASLITWVPGTHTVEEENQVLYTLSHTRNEGNIMIFLKSIVLPKTSTVLLLQSLRVEGRNV